MTTHELRFNTPAENRFRATFGAFYSDLELLERNDFTYPNSVFAESFTLGVFGFGPNYPLTNTAVTGEVGNAAPGYFSDPGPFPAGVIFRNDVRRTDEQVGLLVKERLRFCQIPWLSRSVRAGTISKRISKGVRTRPSSTLAKRKMLKLSERTFRPNLLM